MYALLPFIGRFLSVNSFVSRVSKDYKIQIKSDYEIAENGATVRIQSHTHDIQAHCEPDHKVSEIDPSFRVEKSISQSDAASRH